MKRSLQLILAAGLCLSTTACSNNNGKAGNTGKRKVTPRVFPKVEDLKYAGAIEFEFGQTEVPGVYDDKKLLPKARVTVCIDKSGETHTGQYEVDFAALGMPAYRTTVQGVDANSPAEIWEMPKLTFSYSVAGRTYASAPYVYGLVSVASQATGTLAQTLPADSGQTRAFDGGVFNLSLPENQLYSDLHQTYDINNVSYYIRSKLVRMTKNPSSDSMDLISPVTVCEGQNEQVIVKTELNGI